MSYIDNSFPVSKGRVNKTTGAIGGVALCVADGSIEVTWKEGGKATINCVAGNALNLGNAKSAVIKSGTFHY